MSRESRKDRQHERGFTLAFTIMLTVVLSLAAVAIMTKVFVSTRNSGFTKEHQNTMDSAVIGLNLAIDEISPGQDRMRNAIWTSAVSAIPAVAEYPTIAYTQTQMKANGTRSDMPVRQLGLVGNIRNWEAFADWGGTTAAQWNKGWVYVASSSAVQYFDAAPGLTGRATISVGSENTTGAYWYKQNVTKPPTLANGAPDVPAMANGTKIWPNSRGGGIYGNEYPYGLFCQPVLRKIYHVRQNPLVRVAVYVRMSLQDYYGAEIDGGQVVYRNRDLDGRTIPITGTIAGMDNASASFDGRNFLETNAITFSVFAVSEGTTDSRGVRIHQALNVTLGGAEYISGRSQRTTNGREINIGGLENVNRRVQTPGGGTPYVHLLSPYYAPSLDTPSGNSQLTAYTPITGQVYPASADLSFRFDPLTRPATEQVAFLYEYIKLAGPDNARVVFLIEQIPIGVNGSTTRHWRRRLLLDYPRGFSAPLWEPMPATEPPVGATESTPMMFRRASYSIDPWVGTTGFPSMLHWANKEATGTAGDRVPLAPSEEHFYNKTNMFTDFTQTRYPYTARLGAFGNFTIGTQSAGDFGIPAADARGDVVTWPGNPLLDYRGARMIATMPWQGPAVPFSQAAASVSYVTTTWPMRAWSTIWSAQGGGIGLAFTAATWSAF